ncbi:uncharacterized protein LOC133226086 [Neopsephotus bourkii]|uniref:uncharacterized protein LOC133226086 n=1 Tax=Neopsephotus bourkii TaxID=309878 RepID=UPI002AA5162E|nr:uncharacterized protein LOC133226086 [Neopsephotus bourkii]
MAFSQLKEYKTKPKSGNIDEKERKDRTGHWREMKHMQINDLLESHRKFVTEQGMAASPAYFFGYKLTLSVPKEKVLPAFGAALLMYELKRLRISVVGSLFYSIFCPMNRCLYLLNDVHGVWCGDLKRLLFIGNSGEQMRRHPSFVFLFCGIFLPGALGFPQTNTSIDCDSLLPNYEAVPQTSAPPYIIAVSFDNFEPGNEVQVTLEALQGVGFKGFNLQAREIDGDVPVGTFKITDPNTKGMECHNVTNSAVSHANSDVKQKVTTTWIAPHDVKDLQFIATVVQDLEKFWVGIQSKTLTPTHSESVNGTGKSKRKVMIALECKKLGGTYSTQGGCVMVGPSSSSQSSYSGSPNAVVYTISKNGCGPGGAADAYSQQACRDVSWLYMCLLVV